MYRSPYTGQSLIPEDMTITRRKIEVPTVESKMLAGQYRLYVAVSEFDAVTVEQFEKAIDELENQGMG